MLHFLLYYKSCYINILVVGFAVVVAVGIAAVDVVDSVPAVAVGICILSSYPVHHVECVCVRVNRHQ